MNIWALIFGIFGDIFASVDGHEFSAFPEIALQIYLWLQALKSVAIWNVMLPRHPHAYEISRATVSKITVVGSQMPPLKLRGSEGLPLIQPLYPAWSWLFRIPENQP